MCEGAKEIQKGWEPAEGDFIIEKGRKDCPLILLENLRNDGFITARNWDDDDYFDRTISIWLPRQDQLQEMITYEYELAWHVVDRFMNFILDSSFKDKWLKFTMEQLWLCFVMKEKYNKVWNGENWILDNK
jgi:hypothetical protein